MLSFHLIIINEKYPLGMSRNQSNVRSVSITNTQHLFFPVNRTEGNDTDSGKAGVGADIEHDSYYVGLKYFDLPVF